LLLIFIGFLVGRQLGFSAGVIKPASMYSSYKDFSRTPHDLGKGLSELFLAAIIFFTAVFLMGTDFFAAAFLVLCADVVMP